MAIWDSWNSGEGVENGAGDSVYGNDSMLGLKRPLSYEECKDIYTYWFLGKRIASALPNFAMSAPREISFGNLPPVILDRFNEILQKYKVEKTIKQSAVYARVFGMSAIYASFSQKEGEELRAYDSTKPLSYDNLQKGKFAFNVLDPLNFAGVQINQNPLDLDFQKIESITINGGTKVHKQRFCTILNGEPFYLRWIDSAYSFGTPSIYQNMQGLIKSINTSLVALERMATKASAVVFKTGEDGILNSLAIEASERALKEMRAMRMDGGVKISKDSDVGFFNLTGVDVVDSIIDKMNQCILMALNDTPSNLLLDKNLAQGFGDGDNDFKALIASIESYRQNTLKSAYAFVDKFCLGLAFDLGFLNETFAEYKDDLRDLEIFSVRDLRESILQNFKWEFGNLYPDTEATKQDNLSKRLANFVTLKDLGANLKDIEELINAESLFDSEISLHEANLPNDSEEEHEMPELSIDNETQNQLNEAKE